MATIGLRDLYRAPITVDESGKETYGARSHGEGH